MSKLLIFLSLLILPMTAWSVEQVVVGKGVVEESALQVSLAAFFAAQPTHLGAVATLDHIRKWPAIVGKARWSLPRLRFLSKRVSLIAEQGQGKSLRRWYVPVILKWTTQVITLQHDVSAQAMLDSSMLVLAEKNVAGLRGQFWRNKDDVVGLKTRRAMRRGDVILSTQVVRPPLIQRGDYVTILVSLNGLKVRVAGVALKSGSRGDRLLVQNIRSKKTLQSIAQDAHTVTVFIGGA